MDFKIFKNAVAAQAERLMKHTLYRAKVEKDALWATYLDSFPPGTNEVFRKRAEYDCGCCKQFIRAVGDMIAVIDGKIESIWDVKMPDEPRFQPVADALAALVHSALIENAFLHYDTTAGTDKNFEEMVAGKTKEIITWSHFFINLPSKYVVRKKANTP